MITIQNIIDGYKSLLTIQFNRVVLKHLKCTVDDYVIVLQSNFKHNYFMIIKSDNGYRIRRYPKIKNIFQVNVSFRFPYIGEFETKECSYFLKKNNSIRIFL